MKTRVFAVLLVLFLLLAGCTAQAAETKTIQIPTVAFEPLEAAKEAFWDAAEEETMPSESEPAEPAPTEPRFAEPRFTEPSPPPQRPAKPTITADEAKAIALRHAGLKENQVGNIRAVCERDDGILQYEVEFRCGQWEYEYGIHAETGAVLSWEKDD